MSFVLLIAAFAVGMLTVVLVEVLGILLIIRRIISRSKSLETTAISPRISPFRLDTTRSETTFPKQGMIWVLEPEKVPKIPILDDSNKRKELFLEVSPVSMTAKMKGKYLILRDLDGSQTSIMLKGCEVVAVSATTLSSKKWDKRYPIKVESNSRTLFGGSKILYIYLETCWDKESWCKALRVASCDDKERLDWFSELNEGFMHYLRSLAEGYPSLVKPSGYHLGQLDRINRSDSPPSKVRQLWKKFARKASRNTTERKVTNAGTEESISSSSTKSTQPQSESNAPESKETVASEKINVDEGTLCWNLLISRLFFDAKSNTGIKNSLKSRIQRTLSNMRTPSYIGAMTCTEVDPGNLPPHILSMRAVPTDMSDVWALEMDVEYTGDIVLYIEVRLDTHAQDFQNVAAGSKGDSSSVQGMTTDILQDVEKIKELRYSDLTADSETTQRDDDGVPELERMKSSKNNGLSSSAASRWKSIINSVAKQVAQVPFMLAIRVASMRGTMQLLIKPPPTDQLWFGFTSMPDIDFHLESFVGEHKITSGHITLFLVNRFKAAIRDTLVLPNCESICVPCMLAEKEDWVPRSHAPFVWLKREAPTESVASSEASDEPAPKAVEASDMASREHLDCPMNENQKKENSVSDCPVSDLSDTAAAAPSSSSSSTSSEGRKSLVELKAPLLLQSEESPEHHSQAGYVSLKEQRSFTTDDDDASSRFRKAGRKARMLDLGKKMSEKLEEKRRHIEEKSKLFVDKMRGPS